MNALLVGCLVCIGSFAWGMQHHFHRIGLPTRGMKLTALAGAIATALHLYALASQPLRHPTTGFAMYSAAAVLFWSAVAVSRNKLNACGQRIAPQSLIEEGPYRWVRHPFYTSYNLAWSAGFVATLWWPLAVCATLMAIVYERSAHAEESGFAKSDLADAYRGYRERAGRYLPRVRAFMRSSHAATPVPYDQSGR